MMECVFSLDRKSRLLRTVAEDIRYLRERWDGTVDDDELRRASTVLRRLLVDNELQRAWKAAGLGGEPQVAASSLGSALNMLPVEHISFAAGGGAQYHGMQLRGFLKLDIVLEVASMRDLQSQGVPHRHWKLNEFVNAPCLVVHGHLISRRSLVKYVANTMGGAHFGRAKGPLDESIRCLLDSVVDQYQLAGKSVVYYELLSVGQAIAAADDVVRFCREVGFPMEQELLDRAIHPGADDLPDQARLAGEASSRRTRDERLLCLAKALLRVANGQECEDRDHAFALARDNCRSALLLSPESLEVLNTWGRILQDWASKRPGYERVPMLRDSAAWFERMLRIDPKSAAGLGNLSTTHIQLAKLHGGHHVRGLFAAAAGFALELESVSPGLGAYNLACIAALRGDERGCREWLQADQRRHADSTRAWVDSDTDLDPVRSSEWFKKMFPPKAASTGSVLQGI